MQIEQKRRNANFTKLVKHVTAANLDRLLTRMRLQAVEIDKLPSKIERHGSQSAESATTTSTTTTKPTGPSQDN